MTANVTSDLIVHRHMSELQWLDGIRMNSVSNRALLQQKIKRALEMTM